MNDLRSNERSIWHAGLLQTSKWKKRSLQDFCKRQNGENGSCRTSANVKMEETELAELLQTSKWGKWSLQDFCKRQIGKNGPCRNAASATEIRLAFAGMLQTPRKYGWHLQNFCKHQKREIGTCGTSANTKMGKIVCDPFCMTVKKREEKRTKNECFRNQRRVAARIERHR